jgi:hypothetical protein
MHQIHNQIPMFSYERLVYWLPCLQNVEVLASNKRTDTFGSHKILIITMRKSQYQNIVLYRTCLSSDCYVIVSTLMN